MAWPEKRGRKTENETQTASTLFRLAPICRIRPSGLCQGATTRPRLVFQNCRHLPFLRRSDEIVDSVNITPPEKYSLLKAREPTNRKYRGQPTQLSIDRERNCRRTQLGAVGIASNATVDVSWARSGGKSVDWFTSVPTCASFSCWTFKSKNTAADTSAPHATHPVLNFS